MLSRAAVATIAGLAICEQLGTAFNAAAESSDTERGETAWEFSLSTYTYLAQHTRDYANPNFTADYDRLHLEARYNYEALKTGSVWLGYNFPHFSVGKELDFEVTPMLGGVLGDITGVAPGYWIQITCGNIKASTQGEYFFDAGNKSRNFFYSWSELSASPPKVDWFRAGLVIERTQASGNSDVRRGPLIGFKRKIKNKNVELTTYWLAPGSRDATFAFAVAIEFK